MPTASANVGRALSMSMLALVLLTAWPAQAQPIAPPADDPAGLERSLDMLRLEWKLAVLETYYSQAKFHIPPQWPQRLQDDYRRLASEAGNASDIRLKGIDDWLTASREAADNEVLEMYKLVEERIGQLAELLKSDAEAKQVEQEWETYRASAKKSALEVARFMEGITGRTRLANKVPEDDPALAAFAKRWEENARRVYRGSIADTDSLIKSIAEHEHNRRQIETRLAYLKGVEEALEWSSTVQEIVDDPSGKALEKLEEIAKAKTLEWMKSRYNDIDDEAFEKTWDEVGGVLSDVASLRGTLQELDDDQVLRQNPTALAMVKKCAVVSAIYKQTLGQLKKLPGAKIAGPLFDILDLYGNVLEAVPEIARRMQGFVDQAGQGHKIQALGAFAVVKDATLLWEDLKIRELGLQIAVDTETDATAPTARYFIIVPGGYEQLSRAEYLRLLEAFAYERFIYAPKEAWRGPYDWATDLVFGGRNAEVLSANVSPAYVDDLTAKAKATPLSPADLVALAKGKSVTVQGRSQTHESLAQLADETLDERADEMMLRKTTGQGPADVRAAWRQYLALLRQHNVALSPRQIQNLFSHYQADAAGAERVGEYLAGLSAERAARAAGTPAVGIPVILLPAGPKAEPGTATKLSADVFVSDLKPGRQIDAVATWELPKWATPVPQQPVKIANGVAQIDCPLTVPKGVELKPFEVKVTVRLPADPGEGALARASAAATTAPAATAPTAATRPAEPPTRVSIGANDFGMEVQEPGAPVITLRRGSSATLIEVQSDALTALEGDAGVLLTLYYADSATGSMRPAFERGEIAMRQGETVDPQTTTRSGWIDKQRYVIVHRPYVAQGTIGSYGPFHYQVAQSRTGDFGEPIGKETRSKIVGSSGKAFVKVFDEVKDGVLQVNRQTEWWQFKVALALEDQAVDIQGAHAVVTSGQWTGNYFTSRREGKYIYGSGGDSANVTGSDASVRVPVAAGQSVTVTLSGQGISASGTFKLPPIAAEETQRGLRNAESIRQNAERSAKGAADALKSARESLASHQEKLKNAPPTPTLIAAHTHGGVGIPMLAAEVRRLEQHAGPMAKATGAMDAAIAEGNWAAALAASGELVGLEKLKIAIRREQIDAELVVRKKVLAAPGESGGLRKHYEEECRKLAEEAADLPRREAAELSIIYNRQAGLAVLAGDAGANQQARQNQLQALADAQRADALADVLFSAADETALLSGDRAAAAALWNSAWEKSIAATPADRRAQRQSTFDTLIYFPAYLPPREKAAEPAP